jgi:hypothetical protein
LRPALAGEPAQREDLEESTLLTKNSFLDEIRKQYVLTARMKGLSERQVLYGRGSRSTRTRAARARRG